MNGRRRGALALALAGTVAALGLSVLGVGVAHADETPAPETPLERVNALVQPSIVYLQFDWTGYVYDKNNKQYLNGGMPFELSFQCTGFVVNPNGYIATAGHCVDQDEAFQVFYATAAQWAIDTGYYIDTTLTVDQIVAFQDYRVETMTKLNRADLVIQVGWGAAASGIETAEVRRARVIGTQKPDAGDVALLKVEANDLNALALTDEEVEVGTQIVSIGYPASVDTVTDPDLTPSFKDGSISSVKTVQGGLLTVYEISAAVSGGMSGGPTVNLEGDVVGVNSFGITGETQPFNFVRPSAQVSELLADAGVDNVLSETTQAYRDGLAAYWAGDKTTAVDKLTTVVQDQPSNQLATEYLAKARALPDPKPEKPAAEEPDSDSGGLPLVPIAIVVGVVVVLGGLGGLLLARRGRRRQRMQPAQPIAVVPGVVLQPPPRTPVLTGPALGPPSAPVPMGPPATPPSPGPAPAPSSMPGPGPGPVASPASDQTPGPSAGAATPHFCGNCGEHAHPGERFCENCGEPLQH
jgi:S1-C subfamily serine protease